MRFGDVNNNKLVMVTFVLALTVHIAVFAFYYGRIVEKVQTNSYQIGKIEVGLSERIDRMEDRLVDRLEDIEEQMAKSVKSLR